ncbi:DUF1534 domain-containing protein [Pseudomonas tremae]|uniref:DUF1534 domain-containing protein n=1 Tax=Pseudomonas coronafaciens pv. coronafaciens TaxID=235275 RepID=A0AAE6URR7_9PSED|nr:DUF1534 domain-containing protein [Pseudomonas tremae]QGL59616.1 DUF1534 domain-containing protein [Pseudomonas coronafaciens pv. oryzae str. 1_6]QGT84643.1 DUF1534 domain-containing protein [Pseudomonas coronafaciens pv. coronafaciens]MCF5745608.1 DUF1534 domain-containing protein [Pseudomonas tremae]MCF5803873.1 DUF1534 domain-containing protein [Pseudomonas tremae]
MRLSFRTLQRGNALRDALRYISVLRRLFRMSPHTRYLLNQLSVRSHANLAAASS